MTLDIVFGPMFSGKSTYALSYIRRQRAIGKTVVVIKPNIDIRYSTEDVLITHDKEQIPCGIWNTQYPLRLTEQMKSADCIVFEEAQFLHGLATFVQDLIVNFKKNVLIVGLDGDAHQRPFGEIFQCIPWATNVIKLNALCSRCKDGTLAPYSKRIEDNPNQIDVGGSDKYEAVCLYHLRN